jgi:hypothetical protein
MNLPSLTEPIYFSQLIFYYFIGRAFEIRQTTCQAWGAGTAQNAGRAPHGSWKRWQDM